MLRAALAATVSTASTLVEAEVKLQAEGVNLVLVDLSLADSSPQQTCLWITELTRRKRALVISGTQSLADAERAIDAGACGFVPKTSSAEAIVIAVQTALEGGRILPREWTEAPGRARHGDIVSPQIALTARQWEVLEAIANGASNKVIARDLGMAEKTVKVHLSAIFRQLDVGNRTQAALAAKSLLVA